MTEENREEKPQENEAETPQEEEKEEAPPGRKLTHVVIDHDDDEADEHVHLTFQLTREAIDVEGQAHLGRDPESQGPKEFFQNLAPIFADVARKVTRGGIAFDDNAAPIHPQAAAEARAQAEAKAQAEPCWITDAQRELAEVIHGFQGLTVEALTPQVLAGLEAHLRRRLPKVQNLVRLLELPPEDPMLDPQQNLRARVLGIVHEAGEAGIPWQDLVSDGRLSCFDSPLFREVLGALVEEGLVKVEGRDDRVYWTGGEVETFDGVPAPGAK